MKTKKEMVRILLINTGYPEKTINKLPDEVITRAYNRGEGQQEYLKPYLIRLGLI